MEMAIAAIHYALFAWFSFFQASLFEEKKTWQLQPQGTSTSAVYLRVLTSRSIFTAQTCLQKK
jgi:hypothetical protein